MAAILIGAVGILLLILSGFHHRLRWVVLRNPYGRILGGTMILWALLYGWLKIYQYSAALIIITVILGITAIVCIFLSINEPVR
ncbi:hypothetical protein CEE37_07210 [candidate division LCP-89 bacterium B3_LCP]|uniref:Uncharacterized protein n=1 Tax=candidate division LCP-89 bacterium B3_LCP TaxID=2012998 RepID=A0A532V0K7_UNCL8|nr:MAG: hypothetical protein CEE37_07210 [candidate division LCP-89 bacterium B3_LCP]